MPSEVVERYDPNAGDIHVSAKIGIHIGSVQFTIRTYATALTVEEVTKAIAEKINAAIAKVHL